MNQNKRKSTPTRKQIEKWCLALRSEKYPQTTGVLNTAHGFCCLGVACMEFISEKHLLMRDASLQKELLIGHLPSDQPNSPRWLEQMNDGFKLKTGILLSLLNDNGIVSRTHYELTDGKSEVELEKFTFDEIADLLELVYIHKIIK